MKKEKMDRINELARKSKKEELSQDEKVEQSKLRHEYIEEYKNSLRAQLHSMKIVDPNGKDVTPQKLKQEKLKNKNLIN